MPFEPDILVTSSDGTRRWLVAEVKLSAQGLNASEPQLKRYMVRYRYPTGLLVTPESVRIYRDTFTSYEADSVECVGEFSLIGVLDPDVLSTMSAIEDSRLRSFRLEDAVQDWLEGLRSASVVAALPPGLRAAVQEHVVPALEEGEVRAAGPRWLQQRTGT